MNLQKLNTLDLDQRIKNLAQQERDVLHDVLCTIREIDSRRIYLELGFGSLFDYLVQGVGYSAGSAQRRIDSARLIREIPEMAEKIQSGEINLSQVSLLQKASRECIRTKNIKPSAEDKKQLLQNICNKSHQESQHQVAAFVDLPILQTTKKSTQADESVRLELTFSKEAFAKIKRAQELLSHKLSNQDIAQFMEYLSEKVIQQKTVSKNAESPTNATETAKVLTKKSEQEQMALPAPLSEESTATVAVSNSATCKVKTSKNLSTKVIKQIHKEVTCCEYQSPITGQRCSSTWKLQIDHKQSRWAGGGNEKENLLVLCAQHNLHKYRQETGIKSRLLE